TDVALARYNANGTLDSSFGTAGKVTMAFVAGDPERGSHETLAVVIQPNGRIVTAGFTGVLLDEVFGVARFNGDGSLDTTFCNGGTVATDRRGHKARGV